MLVKGALDRIAVFCRRHFLMHFLELKLLYMMTSSNENIFRVTGPLCGEFTCPRWIPRTKASDAELWCFLWYTSGQTVFVNNREAGGLIRYGAHYDVPLMIMIQNSLKFDLRSSYHGLVTSYRTCDRPRLGLKMTQFTDADKYHQTSMG